MEVRTGLTLESPLTPTARAREKRSPLTPHYWCRVAALLSQTSRDHSCGRVTWQVLTRGTPLNHSCGRVAQRALERRRVQQRCPRGFSSAALGHRPQNRAKGADPRTGNLKGEKWFCPGVLSSPCPGLPVPGLSWFRVAGSPALPLRVPVCFLFRLMFLSTGRGRHVPAPSGRDVGSAQGHRPKNRPFPGIPLRTLKSCSSSLLPSSFSSSLYYGCALRHYFL